MRAGAIGIWLGLMGLAGCAAEPAAAPARPAEPRPAAVNTVDGLVAALRDYLYACYDIEILRETKLEAADPRLERRARELIEARARLAIGMRAAGIELPEENDPKAPVAALGEFLAKHSDLVFVPAGPDPAAGVLLVHACERRGGQELALGGETVRYRAVLFDRVVIDDLARYRATGASAPPFLPTRIAGRTVYADVAAIRAVARERFLARLDDFAEARADDAAAKLAQAGLNAPTADFLERLKRALQWRAYGDAAQLPGAAAETLFQERLLAFELPRAAAQLHYGVGLEGELPAEQRERIELLSLLAGLEHGDPHAGLATAAALALAAPPGSVPQRAATRLLDVCAEALEDRPLPADPTEARARLGAALSRLPWLEPARLAELAERARALIGP